MVVETTDCPIECYGVVIVDHHNSFHNPTYFVYQNQESKEKKKGETSEKNLENE